MNLLKRFCKYIIECLQYAVATHIILAILFFVALSIIIVCSHLLQMTTNNWWETTSEYWLSWRIHLLAFMLIFTGVSIANSGE